MIINDKDIIRKAYIRVLENSKIKSNYTLQDANKVHKTIDMTIKSLLLSDTIIDFGPFHIYPSDRGLKRKKLNVIKYFKNRKSNKKAEKLFFKM